MKKEIGPGVSEESRSKVWTDEEWTDDNGLQVITIAHPDPSGQVSYKPYLDL